MLQHFGCSQRLRILTSSLNDSVDFCEFVRKILRRKNILFITAMQEMNEKTFPFCLSEPKIQPERTLAPWERETEAPPIDEDEHEFDERRFLQGRIPVVRGSGEGDTYPVNRGKHRTNVRNTEEAVQCATDIVATFI